MRSRASAWWSPSGWSSWSCATGCRAACRSSALAILEAGLVVQLAIGLGRVFGEHGDLSVAAYVGYLVGSLLILPIGLVWSAGERTRAGTAVLLVAVLALPVLFLRLHDLWAAR